MFVWHYLLTTLIHEYIPIMSNDQSLLDRVEMPSIPEAAMKKIAVLEEQFARAEVEQCMFLLIFYFVME